MVSMFFSVQSVLLAVSVMSSMVAAEFAYKSKTTYNYDYYFSVRQGQSGQDVDESKDVTINLRADAKLYCGGRGDGKIFFEFSFPAVSLLSDDVAVDEDSMHEYQWALGRRSVAFSLDAESGQVLEMTSFDDDPDWSLDIKKGFLSVFEGDLKDPSVGNSYVSVESDAFGSNIATLYTIEDKDDYYVYTSVKSRESNGASEMLTVSSYEAQFFIPKARRIVERVNFKDSHAMIFTEDTGLAANGKGSLVLKDDIPSVEGVDVSTFEAFHTSVFGNALFQRNDLQLAMVPLRMSAESEANGNPDVGPIMKSINEFVAQPDNGRLFNQIVAALNENWRLIGALEPYLSDPAIRTAVADSLVATGNDDAIKMVIDLYQNMPDSANEEDSGLRETLIARALMGGTQANLAGSNLIKYLMDKLSNAKLPESIRAPTCLSLGTLINKAGPSRIDRDKTVRWALEYLENKLKTAETEADVLLYVHAVGNAGVKSSAPLIVSRAVVESASVSVRRACMYALRRMSDISEIRHELVALAGADSDTGVQLSAFNYLLPLMVVDEATAILQALSSSQSEILPNVITLLESSRLAAEIKSVIDQVRNAQPPMYEKSGEYLVVGSQKMGAVVGYDFVINNPMKVSPEGDRMLVNIDAYATVLAMDKRFRVVDTFARVQGDLITRTPGGAVESFMYFSVAGNVWSKCLDLLGKACTKTPVPVDSIADEGDCKVKVKNFADVSAQIWKAYAKISLIYGLTLGFESILSGYVKVDASAAFCRDISLSYVEVQPKFGLDLVGEACIDAILVKAGISIDAQVLHTNVTAKATLQMKKPEGRSRKTHLDVCADLHIDQALAKADFQFFAKVRDHLKWCGKIPCGLEWGDGITRNAPWAGFERGKYSKDVQESCFEWNKPSTHLVDSAPEELVLQA